MKKTAKTEREELDARLQELNKRRLAAYSSSMSHDIIRQLDALIEETSLNLHDITTLEQYHADKNNNDSSLNI